MKTLITFLILASAAHAQLGNAVKLRGKAISSTAPTNGQVLVYNSTTGQYEPGSGGGGGGSPVAPVIVTFSAPSTCSTSGGTGTNSCTLTSGVTLAITHNLTASQPWVACYDGSGNRIGGTSSGIAITDAVAGSANAVTITFDSSASGTCAISNGSSGPTGATGQGYTWRGAYAGGTTYAPYDTVAYNGSSYVCILASTGNLPTNATYWTAIAVAGTGDVNSSVALSTDGELVLFDGTGGKTLKRGGVLKHSFGATLFSSGDIAVIPPLPFACTSTSGTNYWTISIQGTGTATVDVARVAAGTAIPAFPTNSVTASATPAISSNSVARSTTMTGWCGSGTCSWAVGDSIAFKLTAISGPTAVTASVECQQ